MFARLLADLRLAPVARRSAAAARRVDHVGERCAGAAIDAGVMHLGIEPILFVFICLRKIESHNAWARFETLA